ncbi:hypothetical protein H0E87_006561 [Populus deltoides]|uniref:Uncharacterized protein n=1 Tax=Populus deltoides TaxID=3696 RepID=A0A8T2Z7L3_POPDE|nr:hypothetical protein H0E87_006561 [Populus deltoides]
MKVCHSLAGTKTEPPSKDSKIWFLEKGEFESKTNLSQQFSSEEVYEGLSSANLDSSRGAQDMGLQKNYDNDGDIECWLYGLDTDTVATPEDPDDVVDRQLYSRLI